MGERTGVEGRKREGKGRQGSRHVAARKAGDKKLAQELAPPSEKNLRDDERCGSRLASSPDGTCKRKKGGGTPHPGYGYCIDHGGNTDAGIKSAMREMGHDIISQYKAEHLRFGGDRNDPTIQALTPEMALLEEVRRSAAMVRFLEERIANWNLTPIQQETLEEYAQFRSRKSWNSTEQRDRVRQFLDDLDAESPDSPQHLPALTILSHKTGLTGFTDAREWLLMYREERGHLARVAKMAIDSGVAQRLVALAEDQGRILATALRVVLSALNLSPEQEALIPRIVPPVLRAVAADSPIPDISSLLTPPAALSPADG